MADGTHRYHGERQPEAEELQKMPETLQKKMFQTPIEVDFLSDHEKEVFEKTLLGALDSFR